LCSRAPFSQPGISQPTAVIAAHGRTKGGVASLAYDAAIHNDPPRK
jgi:hypothetical protein